MVVGINVFGDETRKAHRIVLYEMDSLAPMSVLVCDHAQGSSQLSVNKVSAAEPPTTKLEWQTVFNQLRRVVAILLGW